MFVFQPISSMLGRLGPASHSHGPGIHSKVMFVVLGRLGPASHSPGIHDSLKSLAVTQGDPMSDRTPQHRRTRRSPTESESAAVWTRRLLHQGSGPEFIRERRGAENLPYRPVRVRSTHLIRGDRDMPADL